MKTDPENGGNNGFLIGLVAGGVIGAGLALAFAPRIAELGERVRVSAKELSNVAAERYQEVSTCIAGVVDGVAANGQAVRDEVAEAVGRGAREVEKRAMAARSGPGSRRS